MGNMGRGKEWGTAEGVVGGGQGTAEGRGQGVICLVSAECHLSMIYCMCVYFCNQERGRLY